MAKLCLMCAADEPDPDCPECRRINLPLLAGASKHPVDVLAEAYADLGYTPNREALAEMRAYMDEEVEYTEENLERAAQSFTYGQDSDTSA